MAFLDAFLTKLWCLPTQCQVHVNVRYLKPFFSASGLRITVNMGWQNLKVMPKLCGKLYMYETKNFFVFYKLYV